MIRVVLDGTVDTDLDEPPGRILLVHADHTFADLAEAIDLSLGRWDLGPVAEFDIDGRTLVAGGDEGGAEDSEDVTVGEAAPRLGERFVYTFDPEERWRHTCTVEAVDVDAIDEYGEEPETPVPVFGWGTIPDQYWRTSEQDEDADGDDGDTWGTAEAWEVVEDALSDQPPYEPDRTALARTAAAMRRARHEEWPYGILLTAAGLDTDGLPEDDETLWVEAAAGVVAPLAPTPMPPVDEEALTALEPADWAALVIELARSEQGARIDAATMLEMIGACPEVEEQQLSPEDEHTLLRGLELVRRLFEALEILDAAGQLTALGRWGLPRAVERGFRRD